MDGCEFVTSTNIWLYDRSRSNVLWLTFSRTRQCPPGQAVNFSAQWVTFTRARDRAVRRRQRLPWWCVASARSDIRRPPVGQPLALFFTIALPFAGTDVASDAANEPRLGGQLRASPGSLAWRAR